MELLTQGSQNVVYIKLEKLAYLEALYIKKKVWKHLEDKWAEVMSSIEGRAIGNG